MGKKKHFKHGEPCRFGLACVIHSDVDFIFRDRKQMVRFVKDLIEIEFMDFSIETERPAEKDQAFRVSINGVPWAHNLTILARLAEKYDFNG